MEKGTEGAREKKGSVIVFYSPFRLLVCGRNSGISNNNKSHVMWR